MKTKTIIHLENDLEIVELADNRTARKEKAISLCNYYIELAHQLFENNKHMRTLIACQVRGIRNQYLFNS